jgi:opacity protein-like surface antigen
MKKILLLSLALIVAANAATASEQALFFRFRGIGVDEELIDAVSHLLRGSLENEGVYVPVQADERVGYTGCSEPSCAAQIAREEGFEWAVTGSITRLGSKMIVRVELVEAVSGEIRFSTDGSSLTEDDLDTVLKRLARSLSTGKDMESTAEVGMITASEYEEARRRESYSSKSLDVGFLWPQNGSWAGVERLTALDLVYQHDTPEFFLLGRSGIRWGGDIDNDGGRGFGLNILDVKIGRYFSRGDFSPFLSTGVGVHWVWVKKQIVEEGGTVYYEESDSGTNLAMTAGLGITAFRTYDFQAQFEIEYVYMMEKLEYGGHPRGFLFTFTIKRGSRD